MTFDVKAQLFTHEAYGWAGHYELFCVCRHCGLSTTFAVALDNIGEQEAFSKEGSLVSYQDSLNRFFRIEGYINLADMACVQPPEQVPDAIAAAFKEAAVCLKVHCFNAAAAMFRLSVDLATRPLLPDTEDQTCSQPNARQRRDLGLRLAWLFENGRLPRELEGLAQCIREDGNDGAHAGSLEKPDAENLLDFTTALLERLFTEPRRLVLAEQRRAARRTEK
jgi:hypothetical protein